MVIQRFMLWRLLLRPLGGSELLHQLGHHLRYTMGLDTYMFYQLPNHPSPVHEEYKMYNVPYVDEVEDKRKNLIIVPETTRLIKIIDDYKD